MNLFEVKNSIKFAVLLLLIRGSLVQAHLEAQKGITSVVPFFVYHHG